MSREPEPEAYSDEEAQRRFEAIIREAGKTPPQPLKDRPRDRPEAKGKSDR
jgi:hypothetical protein